MATWQSVLQNVMQMSSAYQRGMRIATPVCALARNDGGKTNSKQPPDFGVYVMLAFL